MMSPAAKVLGSGNPTRICVFGASPDTANLGVSALFLSILDAVKSRLPDAEITVFDFARGVREASVAFGDTAYRIHRCGANHSRRYYRRDSLFNMRLSAFFGGLGNPGVKAIAQSDAMLDISGGDSFSDIYGAKRFESMTQMKLLALRIGTPLVLMPQTYGPFNAPKHLNIARRIVRGASMAWSRDPRNFGTLKDLLGDSFDARRHLSGVDVAFSLPNTEPREVPRWFRDWTETDNAAPVVGVNVSGLIYNQSAEASRQFGFKGDYRDIVLGVLRRFLSESDARIVLVPHVLAKLDHYESDPRACHDLAQELGAGDRLRVLDRPYNAMEMKWAISRLGFFCGTRMHSTIGALSSGVPTTAIAYSKKMLGVFETCGQGDCVTDPRELDPPDCVDQLWRCWQDKESIAVGLAKQMPGVLARATDQNDRIVDHIRQLRATPTESDRRRPNTPILSAEDGRAARRAAPHIDD